MAKYRLHAFCQSGNCYKVALYLACAGLDWEPVLVDFWNGETRTPEWRSRVNAMGEVPVLEAGGIMHAQSGAILSHLAEETGKFAPKGARAREEALRWILYDNYRFTNYFATRRFLRSFAPDPPDPAVLAFLKGRADAALGVVDKHLESRAFVLGEEPSIADFSLSGYMFYPAEETGYDLAASHPAIDAWRERIREFPGWRGPYELLPGERLVPHQYA